jgi:hypothetical protein
MVDRVRVILKDASGSPIRGASFDFSTGLADPKYDRKLGAAVLRWIDQGVDSACILDDFNGFIYLATRSTFYDLRWLRRKVEIGDVLFDPPSQTLSFAAGPLPKGIEAAPIGFVENGQHRALSEVWDVIYRDSFLAMARARFICHLARM